MAGRYTGSYLDRPNGWRAVATLADIGRASLVGRIPKDQLGLRQDDDNKTTTGPALAPRRTPRPPGHCCPTNFNVNVSEAPKTDILLIRVPTLGS